MSYVDHTAVGRYYKVYMDGEFISQHTTEREASSKCVNLAIDNSSSDIRYIHEYEVTVGLTDAGITIAQDIPPPQDQPPTIDSTPTPPDFTDGVAATYDMSQHFSDDGMSAVTSQLINSLPNGLTYDGNTHTLSYDGIGSPTVSSHQLEVTDAAGSDTSASFNIIIASSVTDTADYTDPVNGVILLTGRTVVNVSNDSELSTALSNATPGDTIRLATGTYSDNYTMDVDCPANNPVILEGDGNFGAIMSGRLTMNGARQIVTGVLFSGVNARVIGSGDNNKILANEFTGRKGNMITPSATSYNDRQLEIAYNEFYVPGDWNFTHPPTEFRMAVRMTTDGNGADETAMRGGWIHHNLVRDFPDKPAAGYHTGQADAFELGEAAYDWNQMPLDWWVEDNVIKDHGQSGQASIIDMKSAGAVIRRNRAINSNDIRVDVRLGGQCIVEANDCGGAHVHSRDNILAGNRLDGSGIGFIAGDQDFDDVQSPGKTHQQSQDGLVTGNDADVTLGKFSGGDQTLPALRTTIENHTGSVSFELESDTVDNRNDPSTRNFQDWNAAAQESEVGPDALSNASSNYLNARVP